MESNKHIIIYVLIGFTLITIGATIVNLMGAIDLSWKGNVMLIVMLILSNFFIASLKPGR